MTNAPDTKHPFDLEERTLAFAKGIVRLSKAVPSDPTNRELIAQLVRAGGSVGANYREANDALSRRDFAHRIRIARKEAKEVLYWLQLMQEANPSLGEVGPLIREAVELKKILSAIAEKAVSGLGIGS